MSLIELFATSTVSVFLGLVSGAVMVRYILKGDMVNAKFAELIEDFMNNLANDVEQQKRIYQIGAIFAQGAVAGSGLKTAGGKFKMNDLFGQIAGQFLGRFLGGQSQGQPEQQQKPGLG